MFTTKPWIYDWLEAQFERKWTNATGHYRDEAVRAAAAGPAGVQPAGEQRDGVPTTGVSLSFYAGLWAHLYDIYFGTTPDPPLLEANRRLGPSQWSTDYRLLPAAGAAARHALLLEDRVEDDGACRRRRVRCGASRPRAPRRTTRRRRSRITSPAANASFTAPATIAHHRVGRRQ